MSSFPYKKILVVGATSGSNPPKKKKKKRIVSTEKWRWITNCPCRNRPRSFRAVRPARHLRDRSGPPEGKPGQVCAGTWTGEGRCDPVRYHQAGCYSCFCSGVSTCASFGKEKKWNEYTWCVYDRADALIRFVLFVTVSRVMKSHPDLDCVFLNSGMQRGANFRKPETLNVPLLVEEMTVWYAWYPICGCGSLVRH